MKFLAVALILFTPLLSQATATPSTEQFAEIPQPEGVGRVPLTLSLGLAPMAFSNSEFAASALGGVSVITTVSPFNRLAKTIELGYLTQGSELHVDVLWLGYKYYFIGASQAVFRDGTAFSKARYKGAFVGGGAVLYNLVSTAINDDGTEGESTAYNGYGFMLEAGFEQPIFGRLFASGRLIYMNAVQTANYYGFYTLLTVGLPFSL